MDNNFRTIKKYDLEQFVKRIFFDNGIGTVINFTVYSFYLEFSFSLPHDCSERYRYENAFKVLYKRNIITEKPMEDFSCYKTNSKITETFIHPFTIIE